MSSEISIGEKIKTYRKLNNMTQEDLSKESDLYVSTIKKYETGERKPKPDQLQKIADAFGVSVTVFLDFNINTISDVLSLIIKLDEQAPLKISSDTDKDDNYIPESIQISFDDQNINKSICSYLEYKRQLASILHPETDTSITQNPVSALDENKNRLLLTNEGIKKIR